MRWILTPLFVFLLSLSARAQNPDGPLACTDAWFLMTPFMAPCTGILVPRSDLVHCAEVKSDLKTCQDDRKRSDDTHERETVLVRRERDAARKARDEALDQVADLRSKVTGGSWGLGDTLVVGGAAAGAVVLAVLCAQGKGSGYCVGSAGTAGFALGWGVRW